MSEGAWLRDVLRRTAAGAVPPHGDRVAGAFGVVARRRRQRLVAASCTAVVAVFAATLVTSGGPATTGLEPVGTPTTVAPSPEPTAEPEPSAEPTPAAAPTPTAERTPDRTPDPTPDATAAPVVPTYRVPAAPPSPLDVYFLVDATADMQQWRDYVPRVVDGITARLRRLRGDDFMHGFAVFRDLPPAPYRAIDDGDVYQRLQPITADGGRLPFIEYRGGDDSPEAHTVGLDASITGSAPAGFRPAARKVVVVVSTSAAKQGEGYPTIADTVERLRAEGVAVAFVLLRGELTEDEAREQYRRIAEDTGAVAAEGGTCDGRRRLRAGDPLVCEAGHDDAADLSGLADALAARFR